MTNPLIKPTIGRRVWFRPSAQFLKSNPTVTQLGADQPMDAGIVYVHHDHMVNLAVCDHVGRTHIVPTVPLLVGQWQPSDDDYMVCEWMPYQKAQASKPDQDGTASSGALSEQGRRRWDLRASLVHAVDPSLATSGEAGARATAKAITAFLGELEGTGCASTCGKAAGVLQLPVIDRMTDSVGFKASSASPEPEPEAKTGAKAAHGVGVTPADVDAAIASEFYFTAADGVLGQSEMGTKPAAWTNLDQITICTLVLCNGAKVVGVNYGAIDPARHSAALGREEARKAAVEKVWELLGFRLRDKLTAR